MILLWWAGISPPVLDILLVHPNTHKLHLFCYCLNIGYGNILNISIETYCYFNFAQHEFTPNRLFDYNNPILYFLSPLTIYVLMSPICLTLHLWEQCLVSCAIDSAPDTFFFRVLTLSASNLFCYTHDFFWLIAQRCNFKLNFLQKRCFCTTVLRFKQYLILMLTSCIHQCWLFELWTVWFDLIFEFRQLHIDIVSIFTGSLRWFVLFLQRSNVLIPISWHDLLMFFGSLLLRIIHVHFHCTISLHTFSIYRFFHLGSLRPEPCLFDIDIF